MFEKEFGMKKFNYLRVFYFKFKIKLKIIIRIQVENCFCLKLFIESFNVPEFERLSFATTTIHR